MTVPPAHVRPLIRVLVRVAVPALALALLACGDGDGDATPTPYPATVPWEDVEALLATGEVSQVFQSHARQVVFTMKDGSRIETVEPGIDDIFRLVDDCGAPCAAIVMATE